MWRDPSTPAALPTGRAASPTAARTRAWPSLCAVCRGWGRGRVCDACMARYAAPRLRCDRCALPLAGDEVAVVSAVASGEAPFAGAVRRCGACRLRPPPQDLTLAAVDYAAPWDHLIARYKFHDGLDLATVFVDCLARCIDAARPTMPDWLIPAPLSAARLRERGYNQAWELTRPLARRWRRPARPDLLLRTRHGERQMALPRDDRADNVRDDYAVEPAHRPLLAGRTVALVDDVVTTGASAAEMARVLRAAGAAQVQVWALARTPAPG